MEPSVEIIEQERSNRIVDLVLRAQDDFLTFMSCYNDDFPGMSDKSFTCLYDYYVVWLEGEPLEKILARYDLACAAMPAPMDPRSYVISYQELNIWTFMSIANEAHRRPEHLDYDHFDDVRGIDRSHPRRFDSLFPPVDGNPTKVLRKIYRNFT